MHETAASTSFEIVGNVPAAEVRKPRRVSLRVLALAGMLLPVGSLMALSTNRGPIVQEDYYVNIASFGNEFGGVSPQRVIETAARQWTWAGGSRMLMQYAGTTNWTGCGWLGTPNHVYADPGCYQGNCNIAGSFRTCPLGGWVMTIYLGAFDFSLRPASPWQMDFQRVVQHEFGHRWDPTERPDYMACVMTPDLPADAPRGRFFCMDEIDVAGDNAGSPEDWAYYLRSSSAVFPAAGNFSGPYGTGGVYGLGMGDLMRGRSAGVDRDRYFISWSGSTARPVLSCPYPGGGICGQANPNAGSRMRPSIAYDHVRQQWWMFFREPGLANNVRYATSTNPDSGWVDRGLLRDSRGYAITTRVPVGAAYDWKSDHVAVMFTTWDGIWQFPNADGRCFGLFGCTGDLGVVTIQAGNPAASWKGRFPLPGYSAIGPPAVACEASSETWECQAMVSGTDEQRLIWEFRFGLDVYGNAVTPFSPGAYSSGGWTDYPIGLTFNGPSATGSFVAAVTGATYTGTIYLNQKRWVASGWSGWTAMNGTNSRLGPVIRIRETAMNYDIVYGW